jgi:hypothetical protein
MEVVAFLLPLESAPDLVTLMDLTVPLEDGLSVGVFVGPEVIVLELELPSDFVGAAV